ncbi:MAG: indole-3-glycerol phosphate synthase TrpC [Actinobacteria bacterium]|nr:indole-3-glycerol phosphate synthase TrpC [Actinomycetota bacterium]
MILEDGTYLSNIIARHRAVAASRRVDLEELFTAALQGPAVRPFEGWLEHLWQSRGLGVIAEIKRRSPSKGQIVPDDRLEVFDSVKIANSYEDGGAAAISVLTDSEYFGGSARDLADARAGCTLPVLRKDFTVCTADVLESRIMGADAILLIVAALSIEELREFISLANTLGMAALVEVHDESELDSALAVGASTIGVNQRDLRTFEVDMGVATRIARLLPPSIMSVAESGIAGPEDAKRLAGVGYKSILVGEYLVRSEDMSAAVKRLSGFRSGRRLSGA